MSSTDKVIEPARDTSPNSDKSRNLIKDALARKQISQSYHTNMPTFLKSEGPFAFYDSSLRHQKGNNQPTVTDQASLKALHRYEDDLLRLKSLVVAEKEVYINEIKYAQA